MTRIKLYFILMIFTVDVFAAVSGCASHNQVSVSSIAVASVSTTNAKSMNDCHNKMAEVTATNTHETSGDDNAGLDHSSELGHECNCDHCTVFTLVEIAPNVIDFPRYSVVISLSASYKTQTISSRYRPPISHS